jgi:Helix-turn-helix domain
MSSAEAATLLLDDLVSALAARIASLIAAANPRAEQVSPWMNLKSAAVYLDTTEQALRARVKRGEIPVHRRDGRLYFNRHELDQWVRGEL